MQAPLSPEQEAQAQALAALIRQAAADDLSAIARLLVATDERTTFGATAYRLRDLVHQLGAKALPAHLAQKKTATRGPA